MGRASTPSETSGDLSILRRFIPLAEPNIGGNAWRYVKEVIDTGWVSSAGQMVDTFEQVVAEYVGAEFGVAMASGTAALHIALLLAGVEVDDEVLLPALTFIAPANAVRYCCAYPIFLDVDPQYWQLDPEAVESFLGRRGNLTPKGLMDRLTGRRIRAILPVDLLGHPADWDRLRDIARRYDLALVQDATESLGAAYHGQRVGRQGDVACLSFNGNKIITTGGGGMLLTDRSEWARRARYLSTQARDHPREYIHGEIGYNYRLTNLQAALGVAQMEQLDAFVAAKRATAARYQAALADLAGLTLPGEAPAATSTYWLYTIRVDQAVFGMSSRELSACLESRSIQTRAVWQPLSASAPYRDLPHDRTPVAERIYTDALSLPSSTSLRAEQLDAVIAAIRAASGRQAGVQR